MTVLAEPCSPINNTACERKENLNIRLAMHAEAITCHKGVLNNFKEVCQNMNVNKAMLNDCSAKVESLVIVYTRPF